MYTYNNNNLSNHRHTQGCRDHSISKQVSELHHCRYTVEQGGPLKATFIRYILVREQVAVMYNNLKKIKPLRRRSVLIRNPQIQLNIVIITKTYLQKVNHSLNVIITTECTINGTWRSYLVYLQTSNHECHTRHGAMVRQFGSILSLMFLHSHATLLRFTYKCMIRPSYQQLPTKQR